MPKVRITRSAHDDDTVIETDSAELLEHIALFYGPYACPADDLDATLVITEREGGTVITHADGISSCEDALLFISEYLFDHTVICDGFFALHAGAVGYGDKAYIVAAPTGTGKTTLTAWLMQSGFSYITDDCVIIEKSGLSIYPFPKPMHLREGGMAILENLGVRMDGVVRLTRRYADRFIWNPPNVVKEPMFPEGILFLDRTENENAIVRLLQANSIGELMKSPITHFSVNSDYLAFLSKLSSVGCYSVKYSDMRFIAKVIAEMAGSHG